MTDQSKHDQMLALVEHFKNDQPVTQDMQSTMLAEEMQLAADALTAALDEIERLRGALDMIATYRAECHAHDDDMGHSRRSFDDEDIKLMEYAARKSLKGANQ